MQFEHIENVIVNAIFSECRNFRYRLTIDKESSLGNVCICVIMQNPSVANAEVADRSVQFLEKLIFTKGHPEFKEVKKIIIVNQFSYVQTNHFNGSEEHIGVENDWHIQQAIEEAGIILVAWGASNEYTARKAAINGFISMHSGKTVLQTIRHPSRGRYTDFIKPYNT